MYTFSVGVDLSTELKIGLTCFSGNVELLWTTSIMTLFDYSEIGINELFPLMYVQS